MENKSCLLCAWRGFCAKKEIIENRYCPDFTLDVAFLKKQERDALEREDKDANKRTNSK